MIYFAKGSLNYLIVTFFDLSLTILNVINFVF